MLDGMGEDEPEINYWAHRFIGTAEPNESGSNEIIATSEDGHGPNAEYIAALDPTTTLALIARIRETEAKLDLIAGLAASNIPNAELRHKPYAAVHELAVTLAETERRLREAEDEMARLRALSARWQEVINAPVFMQAVEAEAHAYHETACIYRQRLAEAVATIDAARLYCENQGDKFRYHAGRVLGILTRHQDKRENGSAS